MILMNPIGCWLHRLLGVFRWRVGTDGWGQVRPLQAMTRISNIWLFLFDCELWSIARGASVMKHYLWTTCLQSLGSLCSRCPGNMACSLGCQSGGKAGRQLFQGLEATTSWPAQRLSLHNIGFLCSICGWYALLVVVLLYLLSAQSSCRG